LSGVWSALGKNRINAQARGMTISPDVPYRIAVAGFLGLFALLMLWPTVLSNNNTFPVAIILIVTVSPLMLPMRGFLARRRTSCVWLAYVSLFYFIHGCLETFAGNDGKLYAVMETLLSLMIFFGVLFYLRLSRNLH